jgi:hypothetical protein
MSAINNTSALLGFHVCYDRVVERRDKRWTGLGCFSGEVVSTPQVSVQDFAHSHGVGVDPVGFYFLFGFAVFSG